MVGNIIFLWFLQLFLYLLHLKYLKHHARLWLVKIDFKKDQCLVVHYISNYDNIKINVAVGSPNDVNGQM